MKIQLLVLFLSTGLFANAQLPEYFIDLYMGDVQVIKPGKKPVAIKARMLVFPEDKLILKKEDARVTLVNKEQQYIVLNKKGNYKVAELSGIPRQKTTGITEKYFHLVWEELLDPGQSKSSATFKNIAGSWGGVSRGTCDFSGIPADNTAAAGTDLEFRWPTMDSTKRYRFTLFDAGNNTVLELVIRDTMLVLSNKNFLRQGENMYYWHIESVEAPCGETPKNKLVWLSSAEYQRKTDELIRMIKADDNTHYNLEICKALADNGFYELALVYFKKAIENK